jgi:hypothetical protein
MKKTIITLTAAITTSLMSGQAFWTLTNYKGAFPVTDNTPASDWTTGWTNFDPENTSYGAATTTVSSEITSNTTWSGIIVLKNKVYVKNGAMLTIQPGTIIRGDRTSQGTLIITRGSKIMAEGTQSSPIVFTSNENVGDRAEGDWGGVVILGKGLNNQPGGIANIEGIAPIGDTEFGGTDDADNSGKFSFVRIEFAGIALQPNKEINGLTFGSVGSSTQVDHIQVSFSGDDAFEWFGGKVDAKYLISYRNLDDDFDTDFGYRGRVQFGLVIRDPNMSDAAGDSNSFECDNDATGSSAQPLTQPIFSNITLIGPKGNGSVALPTGEKFEKSFRLRRNSAVSVHNSISTGWEKGLSIEGSSTESNYTSNLARFSNNLLVNYNAGNTIVTASQSFYGGFFGTSGNDSTKTVSQIGFVDGFPALGTKPDMRLSTASSAATGAVFESGVFGSDFVGIEEHVRKSPLMVYPNPSSGSFQVITCSKSSPVVSDLMGKSIDAAFDVYETSNGQYIHKCVISMANGIYFISLPGNERQETVKLIVFN